MNTSWKTGCIENNAGEKKKMIVLMISYIILYIYVCLDIYNI